MTVLGPGVRFPTLRMALIQVAAGAGQALRCPSTGTCLNDTSWTCRSPAGARLTSARQFWIGAFHQVVRDDDAAAVPALERAPALATQADDSLIQSYAACGIWGSSNIAPAISGKRFATWRSQRGCAVGSDSVRGSRRISSGWPTSQPPTGAMRRCPRYSTRRTALPAAAIPPGLPVRSR